MHTQPAIRGAIAAFAAMMLTLLSSCGSEQTAGIEGSGAPVAAAVTTTGRITGFGSVFVDGVEYDTSTAQIRIDGQPAAEDDLRVGHIVTISGTLNPDGKTGSANAVTLTSEVSGGVGSIDVAANTFVVLGQTVQVSGDTLFDDTTQASDLATLKPGTKVRVSGFPTSGGALLASRVDGFASTVSALQVSGKVRSLDTTNQSFLVNKLVVDYRSANVSGTLSEGSTATVQGTLSADGGTLAATQVTVAADTLAGAGEKGQIEGLITLFDSTNSFVVDGQRVATNASTQFNLHGLTLGNDVLVKVHGTFDASHVLVADQVEASPPAASLARGVVDAVSTASGTLSVLGVNVQTTASTTFEDRASNQKRQFALADVQVGDYVEVRGTAASGEPLVASIVQRSKAENRAYLQGVAMNVARPSFTVLGITVTTDDRTSFPTLGGGSKGADAFFQEVANQTVSVRGTMNGNTLIADQVRIVGE